MPSRVKRIDDQPRACPDHASGRVNVFVIKAITSAPLGEVIRRAMPYVLLLIPGLFITWAFPALSLWLPQTAGFGR